MCSQTGNSRTSPPQVGSSRVISFLRSFAPLGFGRLRVCRSFALFAPRNSTTPRWLPWSPCAVIARPRRNSINGSTWGGPEEERLAPPPLTRIALRLAGGLGRYGLLLELFIFVPQVWRESQLPQLLD